MLLTLKETTLEAVKWTADPKCFSEVKTLLGANGCITFEVCCQTQFWNLSIYDSLREKHYNVPFGDYVVKLQDDMFTSVSKEDFDIWFDVKNDKKNS